MAKSVIFVLGFSARCSSQLRVVSEMAVKFRQAKPIIILNTCQSGVQGFSLAEIWSWATQFLDAGASAFIGTLWRVSDKTAFSRYGVRRSSTESV
jgi:CHAT domain-containing protein